MRKTTLGHLALPAAAFASSLAAAFILLPNLYHTSAYRVERTTSLPPLHLVVFAFPLILIAAALYAERRFPSPRSLSRAWLPLLATLPIVLRAAFRLAPFYLEPALFSLSLAAALYLTLAPKTLPPSSPSLPPTAKPSPAPLLVTLLTTLAAAFCFYSLQSHFLSRLSYGFTDVGLNYLRVKNTALGSGFLQETLARPTFYDHFNPGLALLVPFYWIFRSHHIILAAQAVGLAALAPAVYIYARGQGASPRTSCIFALAALLHPSVSQIAYSFSYGFHPVTLALPAVVLSIHFWEKHRFLPFAACALFAASFEEILFPLYAGLALVSLVFACFTRRRSNPSESRPSESPPSTLASLLLFVASVTLFLLVTRIVMPAFAGKEYFQLTKFSHLGSSTLEILLSPLTNPRAFWPLLFSARSLTFLALILSGFALLPLLSPRRLLYPAVILAFILLLDNPDVKSISFWYQSLVITAWMPAAVSGALALARKSSSTRAAALALLVAALSLSHFHGLLPLSRTTMPFQRPRSSAFIKSVSDLRRFASSAPPSSRVLATMRSCMLFVDSADVYPLQDYDASAHYDYIVLDRTDTWGQSLDLQRDLHKHFTALPACRQTLIGDFLILHVPPTQNPPSP